MRCAAWDSGSDAAEFFKRYKNFAQARFGAGKPHGTRGFDFALEENGRRVFMKIKGDRVLIIEGDVSGKSAGQVAGAMFGRDAL